MTQADYSLTGSSIRDLVSYPARGFCDGRGCGSFRFREMARLQQDDRLSELWRGWTAGASLGTTWEAIAEREREAKLNGPMTAEMIRRHVTRRGAKEMTLTAQRSLDHFVAATTARGATVSTSIRRNDSKNMFLFVALASDGPRWAVIGVYP